jgi:D-3-phosphoglycerate dehydrogenase / 2-oxoglutarate reductase
MKILITPTSFGDCSAEPLELLKQHFEIGNNPYKRKLTEPEVIELARGCVGILAGLEPLTKKVMDALPDLKSISRVGSGMDNIDVEYAKEKNITVVSTPLGPSRAVAELALSLTLALLRKIPLADRNTRNGVWKKEFGNLFLNKKIGIVGLGKIGRITASLFRGLGNEVFGYDTYPDPEWCRNNNIQLLEKNNLLSECDVIILHIPLSGSQSYFIGAEELNKMKRNAVLINVARGKVVDENALYEALKSDLIAGAAVDVFEIEPYKGNLTGLDNVILTPHLGSYAMESRIQMEVEAVNNLINSIIKG